MKYAEVAYWQCQLSNRALCAGYNREEYDRRSLASSLEFTPNLYYAVPPSTVPASCHVWDLWTSRQILERADTN